MSILAFSGSLTRPAPNYGEANGQGITSFRFDAATGLLEAVAAYGGIDDTSWLTLDAARRRLYAVCEPAGSDQSALAAFAIDPDTAELTLLNSQPTGGQTACHASLSIDGRHILVANYNASIAPGQPDGAVGAFAIRDDGSLGPETASVHHPGVGPNPSRQSRSHAHCVVPSPDGRFVYVADLGIDRIVAYALGADGSLSPKPSADLGLPPGLGPRHLVFRPDGGMLFMISELIATVVSVRVDVASGGLTLVDAFPIPSRDGGVVQPAGIVLSRDGRFLYCGLRQCEEIIGLAVDAATGALAQTGRWPAGGATPRDLTLSPAGTELLVANQDADAITVFALDAASGLLLDPVQHLPTGTPMAIVLADFTIRHDR